MKYTKHNNIFLVIHSTIKKLLMFGDSKKYKNTCLPITEKITIYKIYQ